MANTRTYKSGVKIGNWYENLCLEEVCASFIVVLHGSGGGCSFDFSYEGCWGLKEALLLSSDLYLHLVKKTDFRMDLFNLL